MKILSVRLKNITSLRGEYSIAFNKSPLSDSGLFAITGPTGAGKSSILDAITLALYGSAPRFNRDSPLEIMSYYTTDCLAEVEFEAQGKVYRSKWAIHRSRGKLEGEIQSPKMELVDVGTDTIITSKKTEVIEKVAELTGLDYFRFLRSVMLAQGDFAKFLHADKNEKGELLEKITGTDIYTRISKRSFEKQKEQRQRLEQLESQLDVSRLLTPEQKEALKAQQTEFIQKSVVLEKEIHTYNQQLQWRQTLDQLQTKSQQLKIDWQTIQQQKEASQSDFERLERHRIAIPFLTDRREVEILEERIQQLSNEIHQLQSTVPVLETERTQAQQNTDEAQRQLIRTKQEQEKFLPIFEQVNELHKERQLLRDQFKKVKTDLDSVEAEIGTYKADHAAKLTALAAKIQFHETIQKYLKEHAQDECLDKEISLVEQNLKDLYELSREISTKDAEIRQCAANQWELGQKLNALEGEIRNQQSQVKWTELQIKELQTESSALLNGLPVEELETTLDKLRNQLMVLTNQKNFASDYRSKVEVIDTIQRELQENEQTVVSLQAELSQLQEKEQQAQQQVLLLQRLCETESQILNYEAARKKLHAGEPCPLCGSLDHPYISQHYQVQLSETEKQRDTQQQVLERLREKREDIHRKLSALEANRTNDLKNLRLKSTEVATLEKQFQAQNQQSGERYLIDQLALLEQKLNDNFEEQERLQTLRKQLRDKTARLEHYRGQREEKKQSLMELEIQLSEIRAQMNATDEKQNQLRADLEKLRKQKDEREQVLNTILVAYQLRIPSVSEYASWQQGLRKRIATYRDYEAQEKNYSQEIAKLQAEIEKLDSLMAKLQENARKLVSDKEDLENRGVALKNQIIELFGDKNPQQEKERLQAAIEQGEQELKTLEKLLADKHESLSLRRQQISDKHQTLEASRQDFGRKERQLVSDLQAAGFNGLAQYQSCLLDSETEKQIRQQQEQLERQLASIWGAIRQNEKEWQEQEARQLTQASIPELVQLLESLRSEKENYIAQNARIEQTLQDNEQLLQKHQDLAKEIDKQRREYTRWKTLSDMIGSASGAEFNIFAQGLTLAKLVQLANQHLSKLNPRYHIRRKPNTDLELEIVDRYQADNVRTMKTLSGGETFLVSLSLALGLSDLAGSKTKIDSLFIDEGFGTLDPDTLDSAITTLENLQATGKMIGIISHVDALKERITTQIQITKLSGGVSTLAVVS